jgi:hypothetical protein
LCYHRGKRRWNLRQARSSKGHRATLSTCKQGGGVSWGPPRPVRNIPNIVRLPGRNTSRHTSKLQPYGGQRPNAELDESAVENYAPAFKTPPPHHHTTLKVPSGWDDHQWHLYSSHVQRYRPPIHGTHAALMSQHVVSTLRAH